MLADSPPLLRARLFLAVRYGVDSSELAEGEVIRRVGGILGVRSVASPAASLSTISYRLDSSGFPRGDGDLTDDELQRLEDRDRDLFWSDDRSDEWSEEDHPRDESGRFSGGGVSPATASPRSWMRGFDSRDHQRAVDEHRRVETYHRAQSLRLRDQMATLKGQARGAAPRQRETLRRRFDKLSEQRDAHRAAASEAKRARAAASADLDRARSAHTSGRRAESAARREAKVSRAAAEAASLMPIGRGVGIGVAAPETERATAARAPVQSSWHPTEEDAREIARDAERQRATRSAELAHRDTIARILANSQPMKIAAESRPRRVVSYAGRVETAEQSADRERRFRESDQRAADRIRSARETAAKTTEPPKAIRAVEIDPAGVHLPGAVDRAKVFLRSLLHRGGRDALTPAAAQV